VTFNRAQLEERIRRLAQIQANAHLPVLSQLIAAGGVKLTMDCFRNERDPYGKPFKPLAQERSRDKRARIARERSGKKSRGHKILTDTARMRNSTAPVWRGNAGGVAIATGYAAAHQNGAHISPHSRLGGQFANLREKGKHIIAKRATYANGITIPQRMILPDAEHGMPSTWNAMIGKEAKGLLGRWANEGKRA
jgi:phage gpG-like protein